MGLDDKEKNKKLMNVATEILQTERTYVDRLTLIHTDFHNYFMQRSKSLQEKNYPTTKQIEAMFLNLGSLLNFHIILLSELEDALKNWENEQKIGGIFKKMAPFIKLYATYISGYQVTQDTLQAYIRKYPKFSIDLQTQQKLPQCQSLTLMHHMLEPIQRVPRYRMLLQEYKKYLPNDHADYNDLSSSLEMVMNSAEHANNSINECESALKLMEIQNRIISNIVIIVPGRKIIYEGELNRCIGNSTSKHKSCYIFLFNDIFLDCNHSNKKIKQHTFYQNSEILVSNKMDNTGCLFSIKYDDITIVYSCKSRDERDTWVCKIGECIDEIIQKQKTFQNQDGVATNSEDSYSKRMARVSKLFGSPVNSNLRRGPSLDQSNKRVPKKPVGFPLCDGILDIRLKPNSTFISYFAILSMQRKLLLCNNDNSQDLVEELDIEGYSLYKQPEPQTNDENFSFTLSNDKNTQLDIKTKDKKITEKWVSMLRRSGVIVHS